jgi:urea transport system permease protein
MKFLFALLLCVLFLPAHAAKVETGDESLDQAFATLLGFDFAAKEAALSQIVASGNPKAYELLSGLVDGNLRVLKRKKRLVMATLQDGDYQVTDALTGESYGSVSSRKLKRISINNSMRREIRSLLAIHDLESPDAKQRLAAVKTMLDDPEPQYVALLEPRLAKETDASVKSSLNLLLALSNLGSDDDQVRLRSIAKVKDSLEPAVRQKLTQLAEKDTSPAVKKAAASALHKIEDRIATLGQVETLFFGISLGSVLVLAAIGLAITFGVMGVINMAHGELIMLGAYTTYMMQQLMPDMPGVSLFLSIPAAFLVSGLVGVAIERGVIRFLYGRPLETLLATFGISLILQQLVRTLISPQNVPVANPDFMSGSFEINAVLSLTLNRMYIVLFCGLVFAGLFLVLKRTRLGLQVRAVSQNRAMARAMGVHSARVDALTFGLGSGIAGVAGVALSQLTNVGPNLGQQYIVDSFMVVVFGGVGNLWGTLIGGVGLGIANKFMEPWAGAVMAKILILVIVILFIQKRPRGLFPQKGRAAEG